MNEGVFCGWAVAVVAVKGDALKVRAFSVGTFHEDDAKAYAVGEVQKDYPGWTTYVATHALRGLRVIEEPQE